MFFYNENTEKFDLTTFNICILHALSKCVAPKSKNALKKFIDAIVGEVWEVDYVKAHNGEAIDKLLNINPLRDLENDIFLGLEDVAEELGCKNSFYENDIVFKRIIEQYTLEIFEDNVTIIHSEYNEFSRYETCLKFKIDEDNYCDAQLENGCISNQNKKSFEFTGDMPVNDEGFECEAIGNALIFIVELFGFRELAKVKNI